MEKDKNEATMNVNMEVLLHIINLVTSHVYTNFEDSASYRR